MLSESARNCAFVSHARLLELCFLGGLVCRRSFWTLFGFKISACPHGVRTRGKKSNTKMAQVRCQAGVGLTCLMQTMHFVAKSGLLVIFCSSSFHLFQIRQFLNALPLGWVRSRAKGRPSAALPLGQWHLSQNGHGIHKLEVPEMQGRNVCFDRPQCGNVSCPLLPLMECMHVWAVRCRVST